VLRYKTETRPGLVALYDIRPGNGAGQFLQPRSPHAYDQVNNEIIIAWNNTTGHLSMLIISDIKCQLEKLYYNVNF